MGLQTRPLFMPINLLFEIFTPSSCLRLVSITRVSYRTLALYDVLIIAFTWHTIYDYHALESYLSRRLLYVLNLFWTGQLDSAPRLGARVKTTLSNLTHHILHIFRAYSLERLNYRVALLQCPVTSKGRWLLLRWPRPRFWTRNPNPTVSLLWPSPVFYVAPQLNWGIGARLILKRFRALDQLYCRSILSWGSRRRISAKSRRHMIGMRVSQKKRKPDPKTFVKRSSRPSFILL